MLPSSILRQENDVDLEDSPRPTKRRSSDPSLEQTPLPLPSVRDIGMGLGLPDSSPKTSIGSSGSGLPLLLLPKTPVAPRPKYCYTSTAKDVFNWASPPTPSHENRKLFLPSFDDMMETPSSLSLSETHVAALPTVAASRLKPRASTIPIAVFRVPHATLARRHSTPPEEASVTSSQPSSESKDASEQTQSSQQEMATPSTAKAWPGGKPVPAPTLRKSKSWHALCA